MAIDFSKTFKSAQTWVIGKAKNMLPVIVGVPESVLSTVSNQYLVTITAEFGGALGGPNISGREFTVNAFLQEKIQLSAASSWEGITQDIPGYDAVMGKLNATTQMASGRSMKTPWSTRRKWMGSDPITLTLKLKFEAQNDVEKEVLWPCMGLQGLTLPRGGFLGQLGIIPPGPNPYTWKTEGKQRGEHITVNVGNFLKFDHVIVKNVDVVYENRMTAKGPVGAEVAITIQTYEMLTREGLQKAYGEVFATNADMNIIGTVTGSMQRAANRAASGG